VHPGAQTKIRPQQPAFVMAAGGDTVTYAGLELRSNQLAHFLRASGLRRLDHYAIFGPQIKRLTDFGYHRIKIKIGERNRSFADSPLEEDGFELAVPPRREGYGQPLQASIAVSDLNL
jgi:elongation factor P hydroxylase